ncbi:MAG: hypothetical protein LKKZDAJK_002868 [Candidatus Fervidibacter sp.]
MPKREGDLEILMRTASKIISQSQQRDDGQGSNHHFLFRESERHNYDIPSL